MRRWPGEWSLVNLNVSVHVIGACRAIWVFLVGRSRRRLTAHEHGDGDTFSRWRRGEADERGEVE